MPEIIETLLVSEAVVGILVFIATWLLKTYLDDNILKAVIKIAIRVAHEFLENTEFETHEFIHAFIRKLHASKFDTDKAEKYLLDEEEILNQ